jgi:hypothetical protein
VNQDLLTESIGPLPPSTVDVGQIVRRERRMLAARRSGMALTALVALALTGAVVLTPHGSAPPATGAAPPAATSSGPDGRIQLVALDKATADSIAKQLTAALNEATARYAPEATWIPDKPGDEGAHVTSVFSKNNKETPYFYSGGGLTLTNKVEGSLTLFIGRDLDKGELYEKPLPPLPLECGDEAGCSVRKGPNGTVLYVRDDKNNKAGETNSVRMALGERFLLSLSSSRVPGYTKEETPPLTLDQLADIALAVAAKVKV